MRLEFLDTAAAMAKPTLAIVCGAIFAALLLRAVKPKLKKRDQKLKGVRKRNATGILFGKNGSKLVCSPETEEGHVFVNGPSGTGKTSALLIPTLRSWHGTSFTVDISGDISKNVDMPNKLVYEPGNPDSVPYNIFYLVDQAETRSEKYELLEQLALLLMPDHPKGDSTDKFFTGEGRKMLTAALIVYYEDGADFIQICKLVTSCDWLTLVQDIQQYDNDIANRYVSGFVGTNEKNAAGCKQVLDTCLTLFATNEKVMASIRRPTHGEIAISPQMVESHNLFIKIDDSKLELYAPLLHIIVSQMMEFFSNRSNGAKTPILFCLDEFASFGKLNITPALRKLRKKNVRIMVLTQSLADIDLIYGKDERMSMMNNFNFKVILGATDTDTQQYFSRLIGDVEVDKITTSKGGSGGSTSKTTEFRPCVRPEELAHLGKYLILLSPKGWQRLKKNFYFK